MTGSKTRIREYLIDRYRRSSLRPVAAPSAAQANDGQEEVYIGIEGSAALRADGREIPIEPGVMVRCGPSQMRQLVTHEQAARVLVVGAMPGRAYTAPAFTELATADV